MSVWCPACGDSGIVDSETDHRGIRLGEASPADCPDCPMCGCGLPMSEHNIEPGQHMQLGRVLWAPFCWGEYVGARQEQQDRDDRTRLWQGIGAGLVVSSPFFAALVLVAGWLR